MVTTKHVIKKKMKGELALKLSEAQKSQIKQLEDMIQKEKIMIREGRKDKNEDDLKVNQEFQMEKALNQMYGAQKWKAFLDREKPQEQVQKENEKKAQIEQLLKQKLQMQMALSMKSKLREQLGRGAALKIKKQEEEVNQKLKHFFLNVKEKHQQQHDKASSISSIAEDEFESISDVESEDQDLKEKALKKKEDDRIGKIKLFMEAISLVKQGQNIDEVMKFKEAQMKILAIARKMSSKIQKSVGKEQGK